MAHASDAHVIGLDFGSDSVRAVLFRADDGGEVARSVIAYPRWGRGDYCDAGRQQFRQHPLDHAESMREAVRGLVAAAPAAAAKVVGIGVDTTGSSPLPLGADGLPLAYDPAFRDDPDALCVLWKDHTALIEAEEINRLCHSGAITDYTRYVGGIYSSEWFWAKILHIHRSSPKVAAAVVSWVEMCDWIPALLCGVRDPAKIVRGRCAAGHKALWHPEWGGLPGREFYEKLDPLLTKLPYPLYEGPVAADQPAGKLSPEWAETFGLPAGIVVAVGAFDCHMGAVGAGLEPYELARVMGTSTCDILIAPPADVGSTLVAGICGQVPDSVLPGYIGFEAGQSSFGDVFAWFKQLLTWGDAGSERSAGLLKALGEAAAALPPGAGGEIALDWFNGRRTPDADQRLKAAIAGLHLGSTAPAIYRALIEATAYGTRAIVDRFVEEGIPVTRIVALGGIPQKSPLTVQICADVLDRPIGVVASEECCALGAAVFAATVSGCHQSAEAAKQAMKSGILTEYTPDPAAAAAYRELYARRGRLAAYAEADAHPVS
ncbi:ribulokinase [Siculibacillus lacustris]|uniref:Ribulokinase n=1 Tax=Siculibacillus lacustris TaxID=1549641 RepID=A0A4Q9VUC9_9HYPH|nr:ribulokinase [Siculibacillus lacustris]TBW38743.1 ribulokinase [Siculibacillus lacustris]